MTTADEHRIMLRQAEAVNLRVKGMSYQQIATELGISKGQAFADVKANLKAGLEERNHNTEEAREIELLRLDRATEKVTGVLEASLEVDGLEDEVIERLIGDHSELILKAADRIQKLSAERSKLLGLHAAEKKEHKVTGVSLDELNGLEKAVEGNEWGVTSSEE